MIRQNLHFKSETPNFILNKISLTGAIFFAGIAGYSYFAFLPLFLNSKGFSAGEITFILTWMGVGMAIFSWFFGRLSDKTGNRKLFLIIGLFFQVIVFSLINLNNNIIFYCILNFFRGLFLGIRMPASNALFAEIVENKNKKNVININSGTPEISGTQLSLLSTIKSTGWAIGVLSSSLIISIFGISSLIPFLIIITLISLLTALPVRDVKKVSIINEGNNQRIDEKDIFNKNLVGTVEEPKVKAKVKSLLFICVFFRQFGIIPFLQIISLLLTDAGIPIGLAGVVIALNPILQVAAMLVNGRLIDNPKISEKLMLATGFVLSSLTLLCFAGGTATGNILYFILGEICLGFSWGCIYTGALKYIVNRAPMDRALYMGIWITNLQVAKIISYQVFAFLWIIFTPVAVLPYAVLIPLIGFILLFWL
ncbi:MAG: MFS transporter [Candidatus Lokiarchaeota archaeon]|nr:MFS transporter [Candidatus Lokiarchaeota archaeon]